MNKRYYEHTLPIIRGSLSNTYAATAASIIINLFFFIYLRDFLGD